MTKDPNRPISPRSAGVAGTRSVSFKLAPDLVAQLDKMASSEGRSRNASVRMKLIDAVKAHRERERRKSRRKAEAAARA